MPDDLYWQDGLAWSVQQAALLRRLRAGERVNAEIDWDNVIEEIETLGRSELRSVESLLTRAIAHLLKLHAWPEGPAGHWEAEARTFLRDAARAWSPSMRQRVDLARLYGEARSMLVDALFADPPARPLPETCPFSIDDLLPDSAGRLADMAALLRLLNAG